ncbi:MAG: T9SS type A sorting domain-containing protein [Reichenbachiella sp.]|uniref:T9SS type A sorting domain-containing protein n=2 Tax=Reichenbachiella sp. TaxID=2184521 RepID=UPI003266EB33
MKMFKSRIGLIVCLTICTVTSYAQLLVQPIKRIQNELSHTIQSRVLATKDTISLPFWDDFSFSSITPDSTLWELNTGVLVNGTLGKIAPTINVASFDGNDLNGNPHLSGEGTSIVIDQLTSQPIDLSLVSAAKRASVYLSFYWQMGGLGEVPENKDSLRLEFKDATGEWVKVFDLAGVPENRHEGFTKHAIQIELDEYFHSGFQFQFTAVGNSGGPYDTWHIDYVYLNQDRTIDSESIIDRAIASLPSSMFSQYTMIPYDVLFDFPDSIYKSIDVEISTLQNNIHPVSYQYSLRDTLLNSILYNIPATTGPPLANLGRNTINVAAANSANLQAAATDSLFLESELILRTSDDFFITEINGSDTVYLVDPFYNYRLNDTVRRYHEIHQTLAYDDGQAEYAAGLNKNEAQIAVYFNIPSQDTLTHVDIYFPQINPSASGERIILSILSDTTGAARDVMRLQEFVITGGAGLNVFDRFTFDIPVIVSGEFYVALQQFTNDYIGIGLDNNNLIGTQKIVVNTEGRWTRNAKVEGIIMLRPVFADSDFVVAGTNDLMSAELNVYPNPTDNILNIEGEFDHYELFNLSGRMITSGITNHLSVQALLDGIYLLKVSTGQTIETHKIIVRH